MISELDESQLDAIIHVDASDPQYVYKWRSEQEAGLRASKGCGMTDEEVKNFVDGCEFDQVNKRGPLRMSQ